MTAADTIRLDQLDARIRAVWSRGQRLHLTAGLLAFCRWVTPLFLLGVFIDWMSYMPWLGRVGILITLLGVSFYRAWRCGWRYLRPFDARRTALQLEKHHGDLNSILVSAIQLRDDATRGGGSNALRDRTCRQAEQAASLLRPEHAVPFAALRNPAILSVLFAALIGVFAIINGPFFSAAVLRIFTPWVSIEYPTHTQIAMEQTALIVKEGDRALIQASLSGVVPDNATIYVRTGEGNARAIDMDVNQDSCEYTIASASRDFTYRIKAGDDRTDWHNVRVIPAPRVQRVKVDLSFPEYLSRAPQSVEALTFTVPEGTGVNWQIHLDRPIRAAKFLRDGEEPMDLPVSADGRLVAFTADVSDSRGYQFSWVEKEHGFTFTSPRYYLQVASDQAPRVELTSPDANLVAMLGRPLELTVRAQDDHQIGSTTVVYRVNQRDEQTLALPVPARSGQGDQPIDWDYRRALTDLKIGDTVSFTIVVRDHYPPPQGPHVARSETRRITFLSKEAYLEQIDKKKDRLLSRVQTLYRQERSAHKTIRDLDPRGEGYLQACQLEAIRQEMLRDQLNQTAAQLQSLLDDLAANNVAETAQGESIERVRLALRNIADQHIARAATLLREQSAAVGSDSQQSPSPVRAAHAVNTAARELGSLVLLRSIDSAQEVYAREARMLAENQASLRWRTVMSESTESAEAIAKEQDEVAQWTDRLISDLQAGMRYDKRPLAVLRLTRGVKHLRNTQTDVKMREAGELIRQGQAEQAANLQTDLVTTLLNAEFSVRLSGAYSTLMDTRDQLRLLAIVQSQLREQCADLSAQDFKKNQATLKQTQTLLRKQLVTLLLSSPPAPRARLFDQAPPKAPPVRALLAQADRAMAEALQQLAAGDIQAVTTHQRKAERALAELAGIVDDWSVQLGIETQGLSTLVAATSDRLSRIEAYEANVIGLLEKTDIAAAEEKKVDDLAHEQLQLADDLGAFIQEFTAQNQGATDPDIAPMLPRLGRAEHALRAAADALKRNDADAAIQEQELAADALAQAHAVVLAQNERLALLQDLFMFQRSVGFANRYMADIVAEQRDMLAATEATQPQAMSVLLPAFGNLRRCLDDVAPLLDLVAGRVDAGTPLAFAKADLEDAMDLLTTGDTLDAIDAQDVAAESLAQVQVLVQAVQKETGYVAEIVEFLHHAVADSVLLADQQTALLEQVQAANKDQLQALADPQRALLAGAETDGQALESATGMSAFREPEDRMRAVLNALQSQDAAAAAEQMELAHGALASNGESLFAVITMLHGLPSIEVTVQTEPELVRLIEVLALASRHAQLFRQTQVAEPQARPGLAQRQRALEARCKQIAEAGEPHPFLDDAHRHLSAAAAALASTDLDKIKASQKSANDKLRHFIIEQALILETAAEQGSTEGDPAADGPGSDGESALTAGFISDFVSGEAPKDSRTEWKVLADRNRAALNQNFARELPLEYRGLLKNYYERVAE